MKCLRLLLLAVFYGSSELVGHTISQRWVVRQEKISPDNHKMNGMTINGQFPGPSIECEVGDTIEISVQNELNRNLTIHWHGMVQLGSQNQDGVPFVSQLPIPPQGTFDYKFKVGDQPGTHWYHAHTFSDAELIFGSLIVKDNPEVWKDVVEYDSRYEYDSGCDKTIILSELWHLDSQTIYNHITNYPFKYHPLPNSVLLNGRGYKNWPDHQPNTKHNHGRYVLNIKPNKKCRLRFIGASGHSILGLTIPDHKLTVIEADGTLVEPLEVDHLEIDSGQRYSVLIETNQPINNYFIHAQIIPNDELKRMKKPKPYELGFLHYKGAPSTDNLIRAETFDKPLPRTLNYTRWVHSKLTTSKWYDRNLNNHYYPVPEEVDRDIYLEIRSELDNNRVDVYEINNQLQQPKDFPRLNLPLNEIPDTIPGVYKLIQGERVQLVLQQFTDSNSPCVQHPWHLHGHSVHVVGYGSGYYQKNRDRPLIDIATYQAREKGHYPIFRDTFSQYPYLTSHPSHRTISPINITRLAMNRPSARDDPILPSETPTDRLRNVTNCGWVAIRFIANNPGSWIMHCHYNNHMVMGKLLTLVTNPTQSD